ncbi:hypothetical protein C4D60_Mb01t11540 [Musa balbisiana]|uniref:Uncharacterized protein n=1 Tax=Musa balbisiana TaxID=52838 RepID=A0A4S8JLR5_MUSBA|nr:hypothetical protein C4D60_Mb01t11540 [Musa balbisiana]
MEDQNQWSSGVENGDRPPRVGEESKRVKRVHLIATRTLYVLDTDLQSMLSLGGEKDTGVDFCGPVKIQLSGKWCGALRRESQQQRALCDCSGRLSGTSFSEVSSSLDILSAAGVSFLLNMEEERIDNERGEGSKGE